MTSTDTQRDDLPQSFIGKRIALPETRQLDVLASLLERRGADVVRCPLISMHDTPDQDSVQRWIEHLLEEQDLRDLIILTGEGIARLDQAAERFGLGEAFRQRLAELRLIVRGPKPGRVLKQWGLSAAVVAEQPTSSGVIASLQKLSDLSPEVGVVLYGSEPNLPLISAIEALGCAPIPVSPYIYASESETTSVLALIDDLILGRIDAIAFTSQPQIDRLLKVARTHGREDELRQALASQSVVAAIGPVMAGRLRELDIQVDVMPEGRYFMKPLVDALSRRLNEPAAISEVNG